MEGVLVLWAAAPQLIIQDNLEARKPCAHEVERRHTQDQACFHAIVIHIIWEIEDIP